MAYPVKDISSWPVMSQEARGLDPKDWVVPPDGTQRKGQAHWALFKPVKAAEYRRFDDWAEKIAAELAALVGLPAARVDLARGNSETGILSYNVTPNGWTLDSGDTVLSDLDGYLTCAGDDRPANRVGHNLTNIETVLRDCAGPPETPCAEWSAIEVFAGFLVFDAWIANTDRHAINWGVLTRQADGVRALAPTFDHGSALASGTQDARLTATGVDNFATRGFAGRFEDGRRLTLVDLARQAVTRAGDRARVWPERINTLPTEAVTHVLDGIDGMSVVRRTFIGALLNTNARRLIA